MKSIFSITAVSLALLMGTSAGQTGSMEPDRNPERRGIRRLTDDEIKKLSTPRTKPKKFQLDERKSIFVTDVEILRHFTFDELMDRLVRDSGSRTLTKERLFQQWWDTANLQATFNFPYGGPNCDAKALNTFPYACPRDEGQQVMFNPFGPPTPATYTAIALSNRFDLTTPPEKSGTDCGEYRIVFERNSGATDNLNRNLIIFEAVLPNPHPYKHSLKGCRPVQDFWEDLSDPRLSVDIRAKRLHDFYYHGLPKVGVQPVVTAKHYGDATKSAQGQVRTNQFMSGSASHGPWLLRQFHVVKAAGTLKFLPVPVATNPPASLFNETINQPLGKSFRQDFLSQVPVLADQSKCDPQFRVDCISMETASQYDDGESEEGGPGATVPPPMDFANAFRISPSFRAAIQSNIPAGSTLTPDDIVSRAQTQTCAGCHHISVNANLGGGLVWPTTLPPTFTHEQLAPPFDTTGPDGPRYQISDALKNVFLPFRKHVIETFLQ
jgi:hypothetical protein